MRIVAETQAGEPDYYLTAAGEVTDRLGQRLPVYFLASKALPWWAIGASLIAANISAEQIIGMSGSGYAIGLAIASGALFALQVNSNFFWMFKSLLGLFAGYLVLSRGAYERRSNKKVEEPLA